MHAGFWKRFLAYMIDYMVLLGGYFLFFIIWVGFELLLNGIGVEQSTKELILGILGVPIYVVIPWLYYAISESSSKQATVGKMALGIIVVDQHQQRISFGRATARFFGRILSGLLLCIGYIMAGFTERKQALHDILCGTYVMNRNSLDHVESQDIKTS
ncbi:RDD family protein [Bacillus tianshenii]|uniref:RDD family protein n=1 Tax=Sutcliffiella tianshenii TaxID=1463404 RepID=UPI001CD69245|nr:RDD family protein [Bacillus tianshenii]MCA1321624.1 RDD family protein [Bacillus tianshenii]